MAYIRLYGANTIHGLIVIPYKSSEISLLIGQHFCVVQKSLVANEGRVIFSCLPWSERLFGDGDGLCSGLETWGLIVSSF